MIGRRKTEIEELSVDAERARWAYCIEKSYQVKKKIIDKNVA